MQPEISEFEFALVERLSPRCPAIVSVAERKDCDEAQRPAGGFAVLPDGYCVLMLTDTFWMSRAYCQLSGYGREDSRI